MCVLRTGKEAGRKSEGGWRVLKLLMGKEKGGVRERVSSGGRGVWVESLLNEEAPEPFSLLSKSTLLSAREREKESAHSGVLRRRLYSLFFSVHFLAPGLRRFV